MSQPAAKAARLVVVGGPWAETVFPLTSATTVLGRLPGAHALVLDEPTVSRVHAQIVAEADGVYVVDLDSLQGTWVNGVLARRRKLEPGDRISIGDVVLEFQLG